MLSRDMELLRRELFLHSSSHFVTVGAGLGFMSFTLGRNELSSILSGLRGRSASLPCQRARRSGRCAQKSVCNFAHTAVETAEIAKLRTFVS
jgi:hypothetical protein